MKKLILSLLIVTMLTGCVSEHVKQEEVTTTAETTTAETEVSESMSDNIIETEPISNSGREITLEELAVMRLDEMMNSLIKKDDNVWSQYVYNYGDDKCYLYNVDFEGYELIDFCAVENHPVYNCPTAVFSVEINVSKSDDICFSKGISQWEIMLYGDELNYCRYFLRDSYLDAEIYSETSDNEIARLGFVFSYSFNCFETVSDTCEYCLDMKYEDFLDGLKAFVSIADEITPQFVDEYGNPYYSKEDVNNIVFEYLGMTNYSWNENFTGLGGDRLWKVWDMKTVYAVITEQTDSYIDMVYFADYVYLTPAKKMRYYFTDNNGKIQLVSIELLEDYDYEPNWDIN